MKRVTFKNKFSDINEVLSKIPAELKKDKNIFEMTDGNKTVKIKWEGTLEEGNAIPLLAKDKTLINEEVSKMKSLMGYKSEDTIGNHNSRERVMENNKFKELLSISKKRILIENSGNIDLVDEHELLDENLKSVMAGIMMVIGAMASGQNISQEKVVSVKNEISKLSPEQKETIGDKLTPEQKIEIKTKTGIDFTDKAMDDLFAWEPKKEPFKHEAAPKLDLGKYGDIKAAKVTNVGSNGKNGYVYTVQVSKPYTKGSAFSNVRSFIGNKNKILKNATIEFIDDTGSPYGGKEITYN